MSGLHNSSQQRPMAPMDSIEVANGNQGRLPGGRRSGPHEHLRVIARAAHCAGAYYTRLGLASTHPRLWQAPLWAAR